MEQVFDPRRSPCHYCERVKMSKVECALICDRLSAFVNEQDWRKYRVPSPARMQRFAQYQEYITKQERCEAKLKEILQVP